MTARELALAVARDVFPPPDARVPARGAQASFDYHVRRAGLSERDVAFAAELAYGAIKMRRTLDWHLAPFLERLDAPAIHELLRLAMYELIYTRADEHATVFEFVNVAKRYGHRGLANLVNAVLRNFLRNRTGEPQREQFESDDEYLGTRYSLPTWLVRQWRDVFGGRLETICAAVNEPARAALVVNTLRAGTIQAAEQLASLGVQTQSSAIVAESLLLQRGGGSLAQRAGWWWPQSESSAMAVDVLNPTPGEAILDLCSGRGNKALQIGERLAREGTLVCIERNARRVETLGQRLDEAGVIAAIVTGDATTELLAPDQRFDRILLDAPCSGTGLVGRHPEARWKKQSTDGERLAPTQRVLLERAARHVYPGGVLVYAVCSTDPRETTEVMEWFLARENFERGPMPAAYAPLMTDAGDVLVPPGVEGRDGFYIARLESGA